VQGDPEVRPSDPRLDLDTIQTDRLGLAEGVVLVARDLRELVALATA